MPDSTAAPAPTAAETRYTLSEAARSALLDRLADIAPRLKEAELRLAIHLAHTCNAHYTVKQSSRKLAAATGLARDKVQHALDTLAARGFIFIREGTGSKAAAYLLHFAKVAPVGGCLKQPPSGCQEQPGFFEQPLGGCLKQPPSGCQKQPLAPRIIDLEIDTIPIPILDRVLTANKNHYDKRDLATLREWVDGYWSKLGPVQPSPHPIDDTILAQMLAMAPLEELTHHLKTLFNEGKRPELSPAWFTTVLLQRIHGIRPEALKARRADLRAVRRPQDPEPTQSSLEFAGDLIAALAKSKGMGR